MGCLTCWDKWREKQKGIREAKTAAKNAPPKKFRRPLGNAKRFLITSAQNATPVNKDHLQVLETAAKDMGAELVVIPIRYKNPTSIWPASRLNEEWWDKAVEKYLFNGRKKLNNNLVLAADIKTQPTASQPLTGFEGMTGGESMILGHTKLQFRTVPVPTGRLPKLMTTTGAVTVPNYTDSKAGKKGAFHHCFGASLVEVQNDHVFHLRQTNASKFDGSFTDLDRHYMKDGVEEAPPALGLVTGDIHARFTSKQVDAATFGEGGMVDVLNPEHVIVHDVLDGFSMNPHHMGNPFIAMAKQQSGWGDVRGEIRHTVKFLRDRLGQRHVVIVASNHDNFLSRWIVREDWKRDPENARFYLETALAMTKSVEALDNGAAYIDPFKYWVDQMSGGMNLRCLKRDESFKLGDIECGMHGDLGPNGSRGSLKNLSRLGSRVISGHSHVPGIEEGHYQVGTSTPLRMDYNAGPSSWMNTHCVVYATGKRSLISIIDGSWRA